MFKRFALGCSLLGALYAQEERASIAGLVTDPSGSAVPGAVISVRSVERNTVSQAVSSDAGRFQVGFLLSGRYTLNVEAQGFKKYIRENIELGVAQKLGLDVQMEIGALSDSVTVTGEVTQLETESASRGQLITRRELHDVPNNGLNPFQLVWAIAGVTRTTAGWGSMSPQGVANATNFSLNGGRPGENEVLLDGVSDVHGGRQVKNVPSILILDEFKVITNPYDAQYGRTGGGVISFTTKSGTNRFHGQLWEHVSNKILNANSFANNRAGNPRPQANTNVFGFEADGPIYIPKLVDGRNKLFFMFSYEGWRGRGTDLQNFTIPLDEQRTGDFSGLLNGAGQQVVIYDPLTTVADGQGGFRRTPFAGNRLPSNRLSPIAVNATSFLPKPIFAGQGPGRLNNYVLPTPNIWGINMVASRIDYNISDKHRVHFRYSNTPFKEVRAIGWGTNVAETSGNAPLTRNGVNWSFDWTWAAGPTTVWNVKFGLTRWEDFAGNLIGRGYDPRQLGFPDSLVRQFNILQFPRFNFAGGGNYTAIGSGRPGNLEADYAYSFQPNVNLVRGSHVLKIGAEGKRFDKNRVPLGLISGSYNFDRSYTQANPLRGDAVSGNEFASFLLGYPVGGAVEDLMHPAHRNYFYAGYINDDWKVTPKLTLNLGFRYDYEQPFAERYNRMVRGFAFDQPAAIQAPGLSLKGGLLYAGTSGTARQAYYRDFLRPQPRAGFAWKARNNLVIRGGWGLFFLGQYEEGASTGFSRTTPLIASFDGGVTPARTLADPFPDGLLRPVGNSLGLATDIGLGVGAQYLDRKLPYSQQFSLGFQVELPGGWTWDSAYSANLTRRLPVSAQANNLPINQLGRPSGYYTEAVPNPLAGLLPNNAAKNGSTIPRQDLLRPFPHFTSVGLSSLPIGSQDYHGWQNRIARRFSHGMTLQAAYTVSKTLESVSFLNAEYFNLARPLDSPLERRLMQFDVPQKLALLATYEFPIGRGKPYGNALHPVLNAVVGGWQVNGDFTLQSGFPIAFPNAAPVAARSAKLPAGERTLLRWFDTSLWRDPATGRPIPVQAPFTLRDFPTMFPDVRFPGLKNLDLSLFKDFQIREAMKLNFRAECYNISNTPWFSSLDGNGANVTAATFGALNLSQANSARRFTLAMRLMW
ncbi:MAG: carboxypeptidase regulatory-like domain-containing protein [Bryobacterales bacterium]|nr:carboxypeptidase regulatory-like domain-containing protein [Bryobacterales bacterium]